MHELRVMRIDVHYSPDKVGLFRLGQECKIRQFRLCDILRVGWRRRHRFSAPIATPTLATATGPTVAVTTAAEPLAAALAVAPLAVAAAAKPLTAALTATAEPTAALRSDQADHRLVGVLHHRLLL